MAHPVTVPWMLAPGEHCHLAVPTQVHGLVGSRKHWRSIALHLQEQLDAGRYLVHISNVNEFNKVSGKLAAYF